MAEHALDLQASVGAARDDGLDLLAGEVGSDGFGVVAFVGEQRVRRTLGKADQSVLCFAICRSANRQMEGKWPPRLM